MRIVFATLAALFFLQLTWNALIPILLELESRKRKKEGKPPPGSVSMAPVMETLLLILLAVTSYADPGIGWSPVEVLAYGACAVVASFGVCAIIGKICRRLAKRSEGQ